MSLKIYTRTGDKGTTSLIGGTKVPKSHLRIEAYGTIDELNSHIGLCMDLLDHPQSRASLRQIQDRLFTIGSSLACDPTKESKIHIPDLREEDVGFLEQEMDKMNDSLVPMKSFVLPGGHPTVSQIHIARCVCRRAERCCVRLLLESPEVEPAILKYLNRLSDYLFILARYAAAYFQVPEVPWNARVQENNSQKNE